MSFLDRHVLAIPGQGLKLNSMCFLGLYFIPVSAMGLVATLEAYIDLDRFPSRANA
jgi:hypothetical protein